jgi:hypothetical protein
MVGGVVLILRALVVQHVDISMEPCNDADEHQQWTLPTPAGENGNIVHRATKLCLQAKGCKDDSRVALVLDECHVGCLSGHRFAATFAVNNGQSATKPLAIVSNMMKKLVVDATSKQSATDPPLVLFAWGDQPNQRWMMVGNRLQVGKSPDGHGYLPTCPRESCCLGVHHDVIPNGDGGWAAVILGVVLVMTYLGGGIAIGKYSSHSSSSSSSSGGGGGRQLLSYHPHYRHMGQLLGLCKDGLHFSRGVVFDQGWRNKQHTSATHQSLLTENSNTRTSKASRHGSTSKGRRHKKERRRGCRQKSDELQPHDCLPIPDPAFVTPVMAPHDSHQNWAPTRTGHLAVGARETGVKVVTM